MRWRGGGREDVGESGGNETGPPPPRGDEFLRPPCRGPERRGGVVIRHGGCGQEQGGDNVFCTRKLFLVCTWWDHAPTGGGGCGSTSGARRPSMIPNAGAHTGPRHSCDNLQGSPTPIHPPTPPSLCGFVLHLPASPLPGRHYDFLQTSLLLHPTFAAAASCGGGAGHVRRSRR